MVGSELGSMCEWWTDLIKACIAWRWGLWELHGWSSLDYAVQDWKITSHLAKLDALRLASPFG
jgi:hypothetical protein